MTKEEYLIWKKTYTDLKAVLEKSKTWDNANLPDIEKQEKVIDEAMERIEELLTMSRNN